MANKPPQKWPHYALWAAEDATACFVEIDHLLRQVMELMRTGRHDEALILLADARGKTVDGRVALHKGKTGER